MFCQSHSLTFTFAFMFALCLVSGHTVQIIRAFFCFPVNGVLCFCLLLCHVSMLPTPALFLLFPKNVTVFEGYNRTEQRQVTYVCMWLKKRAKLSGDAIDNPRNMHISCSTFGGEFSEIALFLIPLPWLHSSFLLPSARPSFIFQLECLITAEPLQVWNNARKIPREKLS